MSTIRYQDPEAPPLLNALVGRALGRVRALAAETLGGDLEFAEIELAFEGGPTLVIGLGAAGREAGGPPELWVATGSMSHESDPSNPWQPVALDAHPVWRPRLGSRVVAVSAVRGEEPADAGLLTGIVFTFEDGRRVEVYDAGRCLHMVVLPEDPTPARTRA
ncbi:MAG TPA: hypothetical protein VNM66_00590 [Thermodesulfobacteriota bacterium]|nr:hypothetical protein [Thermodesulfobacteriota bacterium]